MAGSAGEHGFYCEGGLYCRCPVDGAVPMTVREAVEFLSADENREVVHAALEEVCRTRPEWWVRFLERERRIRGGRAW